MRKMFFLVLAAAASLVMIPTQKAQAQSSETPKVEFGVHYTLLRTRGFGDLNTTDSGVGGRLTYNLTDGFSIEGEINQFPQGGRVNLSTRASIDSKKTQGLFGVKYGMRSEKFGIFGKLRPGFVRFSEGTPVLAGSGNATEFAIDIGGVFEVYASRNIALRFDLGDTIIRYGALNFTANNLQLSTGVALRF